MNRRDTLQTLGQAALAISALGLPLPALARAVEGPGTYARIGVTPLWQCFNIMIIDTDTGLLKPAKPDLVGIDTEKGKAWLHTENYDENEDMIPELEYFTPGKYKLVWKENCFFCYKKLPDACTCSEEAKKVVLIRDYPTMRVEYAPA